MGDEAQFGETLVPPAGVDSLLVKTVLNGSDAPHQPHGASGARWLHRVMAHWTSCTTYAAVRSTSKMWLMRPPTNKAADSFFFAQQCYRVALNPNEMTGVIALPIVLFLLERQIAVM